MVTSMRIEEMDRIFQNLSDEFADVGVRRKYFLAACQMWNPNVDLNFARKLRPYGGLIGIDNSSLDKYLKESKVLRLHAILHDSAGFVKDVTNMGPGYSYVIPCSIQSCLLGHVTGIIYCLYIKLFHRSLFSSLKC